MLAYCLEFVAQMLSCLLLGTTSHTVVRVNEKRGLCGPRQGDAVMPRACTRYSDDVGLQLGDKYCIAYCTIHRIIESEVKRIGYNSGLV